MAKRLGVLGAVLAVVALIAGMTTFSAARDGRGMSVRDLWRSAPESMPAARDGHRLVFTETNPTETEVNNPPARFSQGDELAFSSVLRKGGRRVGRLDGHVVFTYVNLQQQVRALANFTASLPHGEIEAQGVAVFTEESGELKFGITGGTGRYHDVGGVVQVVEQGNTVKIVYDLVHLR